MTRIYSVEVAVTYSIKFWATMAIEKNSPPCFVRLVCFSASIRIVYQFRETCSPVHFPFKQFGVRFLDCFMKSFLLMLYLFENKKKMRKADENLG